MRIWLDVESSPRTKTGPGPVINVISFSSRSRLNQAGDWTATVPALDERAVDLLQPRRTVLAWGMVDGAPVFLGGGVIESLTVRMAGDTPTLEVSGRDLLEELNRGTVGDVVVQQPTTTGVSLYDFVRANQPSTWGGRAISPLSADFEAHFVYDTFLGSLAALTERLPVWFRLASSTAQPRTLQVMSALETTARLHALGNADPIAVERNPRACLITSITEERQAADMATRVIAFGAGTAAARLTLAAATKWPDGTPITVTYIDADGDAYAASKIDNTITNLSAEADYGRIERAVAWKDIGPISNSDADLTAAANTLVVAVCEHLRRNREPNYVYSLNVVGVRDPGLLPGHLVRVTARQFVDGARPINIDRNLYILEIGTQVDANGIRTTGLTVATQAQWPASDQGVIVSELRQSAVMQALPQMGPSVDTISYREPIDDDYSADLRFWLGNETTVVNQVLVRFRVDPFRSTTKSVGSTVSGTVDIPDHQHTVDIPAHDHDIPDHQHRLKIIGNGAGALTYQIGFGAAGTAGGVRHNISASDWDWVTNSDSGSTTSEDGGGSTQSSSSGGGQSGLALDLSGAITLTYGIYEDSGANTYAATDLEWLVNGTPVAAAAASVDGGWYALDVTAYVADATTFRPQQAANTLTVRVKAASKSGKRAQVTAQVERRTVIQAIAYL